MKAIKIHFRYVLILVIFLLTAVTIHARDSKQEREKAKKIAIQNIIASRDFDFVAEYVSPMGGSTMYLSSPYDIHVSKDTVIAYLPYFGRAYVAPIDPSKGGIDFTSTDFDYKSENRKKGGWNITIAPKDNRDVRQLYLTVSEDGKASLQVLSYNRQAISYTGYIRERKSTR